MVISSLDLDCVQEFYTDILRLQLPECLLKFESSGGKKYEK